MKKANIGDATSWFDVLLTDRRTQAAVMRLEAGGVSSESLNTHPESDQVLLVLEGHGWSLPFVPTVARAIISTVL